MFKVGDIARNAAPSRTRMEMPSWMASMAERPGRKVDWHEKRKRLIVNWDAVEESLDQLERYNANHDLRYKRVSKTEQRLNRYARARDFLPQMAIAMAVCLPDMTGPGRFADLVRKRSVAMWIVRKRFRLSTLMIGNLFGGRDHATVIHALKKVKNDETLQAYASVIEGKLDGGKDD
jgi:chromosomal replication initiation ATPase DnaA